MAKLFYYRDRDLLVSHALDKTPSSDSFQMHNHSNLELYCFLRGRGVYHIEGSEYPMEPGDVLIMSPSESHYIELDCALPYERIILNFGEELLRSFDPELWLLRPFRDRSPGKQNLYKSSEFPGGVQGFFVTMTDPEGEPRINILSGLIPLLNRINRLWQTRSDDPEMETTEYRIVRYVNQNLTRPFTLEDICSRFYISKSQLNRLFRRATGTTLWQYVTVKRLAKARELIRSGENPTHIYIRCGFTDYSAFYRAYKKHFGVSPKEG